MLEPPLPFGNAAARGYYVLLKGLVERGHRVTGFAACSRPEEIEEATGLFPRPTYDLRCYAPPRRGGFGAKVETVHRPYSYMFSSELRKSLEAEAAGGFDILHLEQLWSGWLGLPWIEQAVVNLHYLSEIDFGSSPDWRWRHSRDRWLARRATHYLLRRYRTITTLTPRLARCIERINPVAQVHTVPLALDTGLYPFSHRMRGVSAPVVSLIGSFDWLPTYTAGVRLLRRLWPAIARRVPSATLQLVGRDASVLMSGRVVDPRISFHANVENVRPYFDRSDVLLYAPIAASGMKVKILEAFAFGVPVVTTSEGIEGLPVHDGVQAGVADDDAGLVERTVRLATDSTRAEQQRRAARALVESHCSPAAVIDAFEEIDRGLVRRRLVSAARGRALGLAP